jgi:hypothetical protein
LVLTVAVEMVPALVEKVIGNARDRLVAAVDKGRGKR